MVVAFLSLISCDPMDDRLLFVNNSPHDIYVDMLFFRDGNETDYYHVPAGNRVISAQDTQRLGMTTFWESEFENGEPDSLLRVIIIPQGKMQNQDTLDNWQDLINSGTYFLNSYSYRELQRREWRIIFPDDGFKVKK